MPPISEAGTARAGATIKALLQALLNPLVLAVGAVGCATLWLSGLCWLGPATVAAVFLVAAASRHAEGEHASGAASSYREQERVLMALFARLKLALSESDPVVRRSLPGVAEQLRSLRGRARSLLRRQARIDDFLAGSRGELATAELARLSTLQEGARTADARQKFAEALGNKQSELKTQEDLRADSERIAAELAALQSALESSLSRVISLEHAQSSAVEGEQELALELGELLLTLEALEQALLEVRDPNLRPGHPG